MPVLDISKDIHSLSDFKRQTAGFLTRMRKEGRPLVLTVNGKSELVVQDAASYQKLLNRLEEMEAIVAIRQGISDHEAGRVTSLKDFAADFRKRRGLSRSSR